MTELLEAAKRLLDSFRVSQDQWCHNALALIKVTRSRRCPGPSGVVIDRGRQKSEAPGSVSVSHGGSGPGRSALPAASSRQGMAPHRSSCCHCDRGSGSASVTKSLSLSAGPRQSALRT